MAPFVKLLGVPAVRLRGTWEEPAFGKSTAVLYHLANREGWVGRDELVYLLWADADDGRARNNLSKALSRAVAALDLGAELRLEPTRIAWDVACDVTAFRDAIARRDWAAAVRLYDGPFMTGVSARGMPEFEAWMDGERSELHDGWRRALLARAGELAGRAAHDDAADVVDRLVRADPFDEEALRVWLEALLRAGRRREATLAYRDFEARLRDELGVEPEPRTIALARAVVERVEPHAPAPAPIAPAPIAPTPTAPAPPLAAGTARPRRSGVPVPTTPFVGRRRLRARLGALLDDPTCRLVSIVGPGGFGKTRLALAVAHDRRDRHRHGVHVVSLVGAATRGDAVLAIARGIDVGLFARSAPEAQLLEHLQASQPLLVLDDVERLGDDVALFTDLLAAAGGLQILATSRERLDLEGETIVAVQGLAVPSDDEEADPLEHDAVRLFVDAARRVAPQFAHDAEARGAIGTICRLVEGMPLALVLAAGWCDVLTPVEIADELARSLDLLEARLRDLPARHRSIRATLDASWVRLAASEQQVLAKLSTCRGGFDRDAARSIAGADLAVVRDLVRRQLVHRRADRSYDLHELTRRYAAERLDAAGEATSIARLHARHYLGLLDRLAAKLKGGAQLDALTAIGAAFPNVRAAWEWAIDARDGDLVGHGMEALYLYCDMRQRFHEGARLFERAVAAFADDGSDALHERLRARLVLRLGLLRARVVRDDEALGSDLAQALAVARRHDDAPEIALGHLALGYFASLTLGDADAALASFEASLHGFRELGDRFYTSRALHRVAYAAGERRDLTAFAAGTQESLDLARRSGNGVDTAQALSNLSSATTMQGSYALAARHAAEALDVGHAVRNDIAVAHAEAQLALLAFMRDARPEALRRARTSVALSRTINYSVTLAFGLAVESLLAAAEREQERATELARASLASPSNAYGVILGTWAGLLAVSASAPFASSSPLDLRTGLALVGAFGHREMMAWFMPSAASLAVADGRHRDAAYYLGAAPPADSTYGAWWRAWPRTAEVEAALRASLADVTVVADLRRRGAIDGSLAGLRWLAERAGSEPQRVARPPRVRRG